jgi:putative transposase
MPRANRYIVPGFDYHLTHRCHDRQFLLKFALDRHLYRIRLRQALLDCRVALLTYNITHNRRKQRTGAFWEGRYHVTVVDSGTYLWDCLLYIELNRVRCGALGQPFVEAMKHRIHHRPVLETLTDGGARVLREDYGPVFRPKN